MQIHEIVRKFEICGKVFSNLTRRKCGNAYIIFIHGVTRFTASKQLLGPAKLDRRTQMTPTHRRRGSRHLCLGTARPGQKTSSLVGRNPGRETDQRLQLYLPVPTLLPPFRTLPPTLSSGSRGRSRPVSNLKDVLMSQE